MPLGQRNGISVGIVWDAFGEGTGIVWDRSTFVAPPSNAICPKYVHHLPHSPLGHFPNDASTFTKRPLRHILLWYTQVRDRALPAQHPGAP